MGSAHYAQPDFLSDAVVTALISAGATTEMVAAARAAARVEYERRRVKERPKEVAWKRRERARKCQAGQASSAANVAPDIDLVSRDDSGASGDDTQSHVQNATAATTLGSIERRLLDAAAGSVAPESRAPDRRIARAGL
jgi:hypothetical protein